MHEMALCESLLQAMEEAGRANGFSRVSRVRLEIGRFAGVEVEALRFGFDVVTRGSLADGAEFRAAAGASTATTRWTWTTGCRPAHTVAAAGCTPAAAPK